MTQLSDHSTLTAFAAQFSTESYPVRSVILAAGEPATFFYYIEKGAVKMSTTSNKGRNFIVHTFFPGAFFSLFSLIPDQPNSYDFIALLPTVVRKIPQSALIDFLKADSDAMFELQTRLLKGLAGLTKRIERLALAPAYQQVASLLVYFADHFAEPSSDTTPTSHPKFVLKITHQEMSEWLGLSRENVSIQMKQLERNKVITHTDRYIEIVDLNTLKNLAANRDTM